MQKSIIKKITEEKLEKYLQKIGWGIRGNKLNRYIFDDEGKNTPLRIWDNHIEMNKEFSGAFQLHFSEFWLEYVDDGYIYPMVSFVLPKGNTLKGSMTFISFYGKKEEKISDN